MNKAIKSVFLVLGIGAFLQVSGVVSYATWTGAENGYWTNANNWVDGQIGGRWLVRDAGGNLATNGVKGSTAYFGAEGATGATTINFDGVVSVSNILVTGGSAAPRYTFGTATTQNIPMEAYGTFSAAETEDTPVAVIGGKFYGPLEANGRGYGADNLIYRNNNTSETLALARWSGNQVWAGPVTDIDKHNGEPRTVFEGAGNIRLDADSQGSSYKSFTMTMTGKLIVNCDFKKIRSFSTSGSGTKRIEILSGASMRHGSGFYDFLLLSTPLEVSGDGTFYFGAGFNKFWKNSQNKINETATFSCPVTSVRTTQGYTDADWLPGVTFYSSSVGPCTFLGENTIPGDVLMTAYTANFTLNCETLGLQGTAGSHGYGNFIGDNRYVIRYTGTGDTTDRSFCVTNTGSYTHAAVIEQAGTGPLVVNSAVTKSANVTAPTFVLRNGTDQAATFGGTLGNDFKLTKDGAGTWTIASALTYTGVTTVEAGTLEIAPDGSIANSSGISVAANAALVMLGDGGNAVAKTVPPLTVTGAGATLRVDAGVSLTVSSLSATGAGTLDIVTEGATASVKLAGSTGGNAPLWLTLNGQPVEYDENGVLRKRTVATDTDIPAYGGVIPNDSTKAVGVTTVGTPGDGPITLAANATTVSTLAQKTSVEAVVDLAADRTLTAAQLAVTEGAAPLTIGSVDGQGTFAAASGNLTLYPDAGREITVKATPSLAAATQIDKIGDGTARFTTNFVYSGTVQIKGGELAVTPSDASQTFALSGGGTFAKEGEGDWTVPSGKNTGFSGDYIVRGGTVTPGATSAATLFGVADHGDLVISNGAAFHYGPTLSGALDFGHKHVRLAGDGPDGKGAFVVDMPASRAANSVTIPFLTLDGDTLMNFTNVTSTSHAIGLSEANPGLFDMQGHTFTRKGSCRLVMRGCAVTNGGAIRVEGPVGNVKKELTGYLVLQNGLNFTDTPPTIYMTNNTYICTQNCSPVPCPIEIAPNSFVWAGTFAQNMDTNFNNLAGPIHLADETSILSLDTSADGTRLLTLSGEISGSGIITNSGGSSKFFIAAPVNTFTGKTCIALPAGSGSFGSITYARPTSLPDFSKATFNGYGTANVRVSSDQSSWPHAEIGRFMREATFTTSAMVGIDTTDTGDYTIDVSSLGAVPTKLTGLAIAATCPNNDVLTLNLDADFKAYSVMGLGTYCGTLRVVGTGGVLGLRFIRIGADRVPGITGTVEITGGATVRLSDDTVANSSIGGVDDTYGTLRVANGTLDIPENKSSVCYGMFVGGVTKSRGILDVRQDGELRNARLYVGAGGNARGGAVYLSGNAKIGLAAKPTYIGYVCGGYVDMASGEISCTDGGYLRMGNPNLQYAGTYAIISQSGGMIRITSDTGLVGSTCDQAGFIRLTGDAEFYVAPKSWTHALEWPCSTSTTGISADSLGVISLDSANAHFSVASNKVVFLANQPNGTAIVNLNAGVFEMGAYEACASGHAGSAAYVNFNGGTLKANANNADFLKGTTRVLLDVGGATVDTAGHDVTIKEPFAAPTGNGVASIELPASLANTTNAHMPWAVRIEGDGTGATAIIAHDRATQRMTHVIVTSPGCNYTTAKAIFWAGQTGSVVANRPDKPITNECVLAANAVPGVFTKKGTGTLTFGAGGGLPAGASVDVQEGTLDLNGTSANLANVTSSGNGTIINGSASITLPSTMAIDVASAQAGHYLTVGGDATLPSTLTLLNIDQVDAKAKSFTILKVTGTATGALPAIDPATPTPPAWQLYWTGSELKLGVPRATRLYFR